MGNQQIPPCRYVGCDRSDMVKDWKSGGYRTICRYHDSQSRQERRLRRKGDLSQSSMPHEPPPIERAQLHVTGNDNEIDCSSSGPQIKSLKAMLEAADVPLGVLDEDGDSEFVIDGFEVSKHDQGMKIHDSLQMVDLWRVKAKLKRRSPLATKFPALMGVEVHIGDIPTYTNPDSQLKRAILIPDSQHGFLRDMMSGKLDPFHDRKAWDVMVKIAHDIKPDLVVLLGDHLDLPDWSDKFTRTPAMHWTTQPALLELAYDLGKLRKAVGSNAKMYYLEGNHEKRMTTAVYNHLIAAADLRPADELYTSAPVLSIDRLLGLSKLDIEYRGPYPDGEVFVNENLRASHGDIARARSGDTARAVLQKGSRHSEVFGHVHRIEIAHQTMHGMKGPTSHQACSPGTLARIDGAVPAHSKRNNWQNGFAVVDYEEGDGMFRLTVVDIHRGRAIWDQQIYEGEFDVNILKEATGWEHF